MVCDCGTPWTFLLTSLNLYHVLSFGKQWKTLYELSHVMRKPVNAVCEHQRRSSAWASAQSDQRICFPCLDSIIHLVSISEISSLYVAYVAEQAGLSLTWSEIPKTGFLVTWLNQWSAATTTEFGSAFQMSRLVTKPTKWVSEDSESAWASALSDLSFRCPREESLDP